MSVPILPAYHPPTRATDAARHSAATCAIDDLTAELAALRHAEARITEWSATRDELRRMITDRIGSAETGTVRGIPVVRYSRIVQRHISAALVREIAPIDVIERCTVISERRRFMLVTPEGGAQQ